MGGIVIDDITKLPAAKRAARYREMALDAEAKAATVTPWHAIGYITLAEDWRKLAILIELTAL